MGVVATAAVVLSAQDPPKIKPSQHGTVSQRIADTTITVEYNRPVARGRELFGRLVPYGRIWCPCADDATTVDNLLHGADAALAEAKRTGKNRYCAACHTPELRAQPVPVTTAS